MAMHFRAALIAAIPFLALFILFVYLLILIIRALCK